MNSLAPINPALVDVFSDKHDGYPDELAGEDTRDVLYAVCGSASRDFPKALWIEPRDWEEKARENDEYKTWAINYIDRFTHQGDSHECTCHALRVLFESARNRQRGIIFADGPKVNERYAESALGSVWVSALSIYAKANPRQWGGANCKATLEIALRDGFMPEPTQPRDYGFKHTLHGTAGGQSAKNQSTGRWVRESDFPDGYEETAIHLKPDEVIFPDEWEQAVCLLLHGYALEYGRNGHAVPPAIWNVRESKAGYVDSYNRILWDSLATFKRASQGCFAIATTRTPDDWLNPTKV
jgi:hypothetical protein